MGGKKKAVKKQPVMETLMEDRERLTTQNVGKKVVEENIKEANIERQTSQLRVNVEGQFRFEEGTQADVTQIDY